MTRLFLCSVALILGTAPVITATAAEPGSDGSLELFARSRVQDAESDGDFRLAYENVQWDANKTAVVICDMWARHWCDGACKRGAEMAPRMNEFVDHAR